MLRIIIVWVGILLTTSCAWQNTVHTIAQTPEYLRLDERIWVENAPRWRLPADAQLSVVDDGESPHQWVEAATAGVTEVFSGSANQASYKLEVRWPIGPAPTDKETGEETEDPDRAGLMDFVHLPKIPAVQRLNVKLLDHQGQFIASMNLHISPEVWGPTWQDMNLLQYSFAQLASTLRGG